MADNVAAAAILDGINAFISRGPSSLHKVNIVVFDKPRLPTFQREQMNRSMAVKPEQVPCLNYNIQLANGVMLSVEEGDISMDSSEVIVAPTGKVLNAVTSKSAQTKSELDMKSNPKTVVDISAGGQLRCRRVYVVPMSRQSQNDTDDQYIRNYEAMVDQSLKMANSSGFSSIAIPILEMGTIRHEDKHAVAAVMRASKTFADKVSFPKLLNIKLFVSDADRVPEVMAEVLQFLRSHGNDTTWFQRLGTGIKSLVSSLFSPGEDTVKPNRKRREMRSFSEGEPDKALVSIFASSTSDCSKTHSSLMKAVNLFCITKTVQIKDSVPDGFDTIQLKKAAAKLGVSLSFHVSPDKKSVPQITLSGFQDDVSEMHTKVLQQLATALAEENEAVQNERILEVARWYYQDDDGVFKEYPPDVMVKLEKAYQDQEETRVSFLSDSDFLQYEVDFSAMKQVMFDGRKIQVKRVGRAQGHGRKLVYI